MFSDIFSFYLPSLSSVWHFLNLFIILSFDLQYFNYPFSLISYLFDLL